MIPYVLVVALVLCLDPCSLVMALVCCSVPCVLVALVRCSFPCVLVALVHCSVPCVLVALVRCSVSFVLVLAVILCLIVGTVIMLTHSLLLYGPGSNPQIHNWLTSGRSILLLPSLVLDLHPGS